MRPCPVVMNSESAGVGPGKDVRDRFYLAVTALRRDDVYALRRELAFVNSKTWVREAFDNRARSLFHLAVQHEAHACAVTLFDFAGLETQAMARGALLRADVARAAKAARLESVREWYDALLERGGDAAERGLPFLEPIVEARADAGPATLAPAATAPSSRAAKRPQPPRATGWSRASSARRAVGLAANEAPSAHRPAYFLERPGAPERTRDDDDSSASDDDGGPDSDGRAALLECLFCRDTGEPEAHG